MAAIRTERRLKPKLTEEEEVEEEVKEIKQSEHYKCVFKFD